jgi:hypothetical protein
MRTYARPFWAAASGRERAAMRKAFPDARIVASGLTAVPEHQAVHSVAGVCGHARVPSVVVRSPPDRRQSRKPLQETRGRASCGCSPLLRALPSDGGAEATTPECPINALLHALSSGDRQHTHRHIRRGSTDVTACERTLYMRSQLLRQTDWAGMPHSAETRTSLVDGQLFRALAPALLSPEPSTKSVFVAVGTLRLQSAVVTRPKTGFEGPIAPRLAQWAGRGRVGSRDWGKYVYRRATAPAPNSNA